MSLKRFAALLALASACGARTPAPTVARPSASSQAGATPRAAPATRAPSDAQAEAEYDERVRAALERVARVRGLPIRKPVHSRVLDRSAIVERLQAKVEKEIPKGV